MAFAAIESVRKAEQEAEQRIQEADKIAACAVAQAKDTYESIISAAVKDAEVTVAHSVDKASAKAEEIIVTARNSALLEADNLKNQCISQQQAVNKSILELIV